MKRLIPSIALALYLSGCGAATKETSEETSSVTAESTAVAEITHEAVSAAEKPKQISKAKPSEPVFETLAWEDLLPEGEEEILDNLYAEFFEAQETELREQIPLSKAAETDIDIATLIEEGSVQDTMEQIGTYNVVDDLDGAKVRLPGYVVPLDFKASSEYTEFLLVPYFGACLHTPPPPPNQIIYVKSSPASKITDLYEPVWIEGVMKTGKFGTDLGNSAYELTLVTLKPYEY